MSRGFNFGAGPAMLPEQILIEAREELLNWHDSGMSVMEIGHRTKEFTALIEEAEHCLRELLSIPTNYHVLFLGGAARTQFSMIPMNFLKGDQEAAYVISGIWSQMAYDEACKLKHAYCATRADSAFTWVPDEADWQIKKNTTYLYYTPNETVNGLQIQIPPVSFGLPVVADMTSCLLTEPINVEDYDLIFAGAQKNIANAGLTIVIVRDELIQTIDDNHLPTMMDYRTFTSTRSMYATPPTFNCYLALKMFHWIAQRGGIRKLHEINLLKAKMLYDYIDSNPFYHCKIKPQNRSMVNVCFSLDNADLEPTFLSEASKENLLALAGHRLVGGLRASLYNSMPLAGVEQLIGFMDFFAKEHL